MNQRLRFQALQRDAFTCQYCGRKAPDVVLEVDHVIPRSSGGSDSLENLRTACRECNQGKHCAPLTEELDLGPERLERHRLHEALELGLEVLDAESSEHRLAKLDWLECEALLDEDVNLWEASGL